ncbi:hypothetical protein [Hymenobacter properus]|uniref:Uncharacterized protein n=1 Tax=Hymenobacter properus TaxID=2791026 RepID=A0A931FJI0_9BACT|nr:hypothetical protein [Hymenobacter properus]MBF9143007.1 hypothetical protein [Hymenobacter properus]MBR7721815.1 hypothetical protein [Microvirga sp. SRT04]
MKTETGGSRWSRFLFWTALFNGLGLCGLLIWLFFNFQSAEHHFWLHWLALACWALLLMQGLLALVVMVHQLWHRRWSAALVWLLWAGLGLGLCMVTMFPVTVLFGIGSSVGEPPPGSPE